MIKIIVMPTIPPFTAEEIASSMIDPVAKQRQTERKNAFSEKQQEALNELDEALNNGFVIVSNNLIQAHDGDKIFYVLYNKNK